MICVGIDVAKDKHDCFILSSEGEVWQMYSPFQTMQRDLTPFCRPFIAVPVRKIK